MTSCSGVTHKHQAQLQKNRFLIHPPMCSHALAAVPALSTAKGKFSPEAWRRAACCWAYTAADVTEVYKELPVWWLQDAPRATLRLCLQGGFQLPPTSEYRLVDGAGAHSVNERVDSGFTCAGRGQEGLPSVPTHQQPATDLDDGVGEVHLLQDDGVILDTKRLARGGILSHQRQQRRRAVRPPPGVKEAMRSFVSANKHLMGWGGSRPRASWMNTWAYPGARSTVCRGPRRS